MKKILGSFVGSNLENFKKLSDLFEANGYDLAIQTEQGNVVEALILSDVEIKTEEGQIEEVKE